MGLIDVLPSQPEADSVYEAFMEWVEQQALSLYPHQEEAAIELFSGNNVILATLTGSGKSIVAPRRLGSVNTAACCSGVITGARRIR